MMAFDVSFGCQDVELPNSGAARGRTTLHHMLTWEAKFFMGHQN